MAFKLPLSTLCTAAAGAVAALAIVQESWGYLGVSIALALIAYVHHRQRRKRLTESVTLLTEAIAHHDYSFRLPVAQDLESILQEAFNHFIVLLGQQKVQMEQREAFFAQVLSNVTTGIVVLDAENQVVQTNRAANQLLGVTGLQTLNQLEQYGPSVAGAFQHLAPGERQHLRYTSTKGEIYLQLHASSIQLGDKPLRILALNDIHHELNAQEQESWSKLTRVLTHEIMNSIAPITSLSETLMQRADVRQSPLADAIGAIHETSAGLMNFVESYRKYSALQQPQPEPFYVRELLEQVKQLSLLPPSIQLTSQQEPDDLMIYADPHLIRQVLINLLRNAVEAIGPHTGRIHLRAFLTPNEQVYIHVNNNGPIIPAAEAENIFVPFFTTKPQGSGIGLSLSRQIMKLSGGNLSLLRPKTNGWNTTFVLEFN